jgi:hypothetical protein
MVKGFLFYYQVMMTMMDHLLKTAIYAIYIPVARERETTLHRHNDLLT